MPDQPVITLIHHHHNTAELNNTAAVHLMNRGFVIQNRFPFDGDKLQLSAKRVTPTIVLGGGQNVTDLSKHDYLNDELRWIETCVEESVPVLGICLGAQLMAHALGATVSQRDPEECQYGFYEVSPTAEATQWLPAPQYFMQAHYQEFSLPNGALQLATNDQFNQQAFRYGEQAYAVQFHPEVNTEIFNNWLADSWSDEMEKSTGSQRKNLQSALAKKYIAPQTEWFKGALNKVFVC